MRTLYWAALVLLAVTACAPASTMSPARMGNVNVKDAAGTTRTMATTQIGGAEIPWHMVTGADGASFLSLLAAGADGTTNAATLARVGSYGLIYNGTTWDRARGDTTYGADCDVTRLPVTKDAQDRVTVRTASEAPVTMISGSITCANTSLNSMSAQAVTTPVQIIGSPSLQGYIDVGGVRIGPGTVLTLYPDNLSDITYQCQGTSSSERFGYSAGAN